MEVSALRYSGGIGLHGRSPLLRLQSDERLVAFVRRGSSAAFEVLVSRYQSRLLAFCRHLLGSREDAEDVLQEVFSAAFNAILADERPINVRPWLYRIARNRSLNHLRRIQAVGVDSMDIHFSDHGASTADKVHKREEFRMLLDDIQELPETQRTALVLREMDAMSYEQIAEAMETTVPSVKSLLVRARVSLAEAAEARLLSCAEVRIELGEVAEGLARRPGPLVRRHLRACKRCSAFNHQLKQTNKALTALLPIGPLVILKKLALAHIGHSAGSSASGTAVGSTAAAGGAVVGTGAGSVVSAGVTAVAGKAAASLAAAALVTAGAVEVSQPAQRAKPKHVYSAAGVVPALETEQADSAPHYYAAVTQPRHISRHRTAKAKTSMGKPATVTSPTAKGAAKSKQPAKTNAKSALRDQKKPLPGRTQTQTDPTVLVAPPPAPPPTQAVTTTPATDPTQATTPTLATGTTPSTTTPTTPTAPTPGSSTDAGTPPPTGGSSPSGGAPAAPTTGDPAGSTTTGPSPTPAP
jgi:RNA polymerase sigma factor (sigma-70 family)